MSAALLACTRAGAQWHTMATRARQRHVLACASAFPPVGGASIAKCWRTCGPWPHLLPAAARMPGRRIQPRRRAVNGGVRHCVTAVVRGSGQRDPSSIPGGGPPLPRARSVRSRRRLARRIGQLDDVSADLAVSDDPAGRRCQTTDVSIQTMEKGAQNPL